MITTDKLLRAIDKKRVALAAEAGSVEPVPYSEVADTIGVHRSLFSRLKKGHMPGANVVEALKTWADMEELDCQECEEVDREGLQVITEDDLDSESEVKPDDSLEKAESVEEEAAGEVKTVFALGRFSDSDDPETQSAVARARELLAEGAVGVSVALDIHPDDMAIIMKAEEEAIKNESPQLNLPEGFQERQRIRHTAIVDTPAFADARLREREDGVLEGEIVFEGVYTGDGRTFPAGSIDLDSSNLPSPIIWDRHDGDHTGMTIGYITEWERRDASNTSARTVLDDEAITASLAPLELPAQYFAMSNPTKREPMRISKPDEKGYRRIYGLAAPNGVCIRNSMQCWTWPGDKDKQHRNFHTGTLIRLDDGSDIRVGALTIGGEHLEGALARQGVSAKDTGNHRDNANRVLALVRVWESRFGLMLSGIIPPDVTESDVARALACSPSIEFWPENGGRTLVGLHLVPTPGLPVMASTGSAEHYVTDISITLEDEDGSDDGVDDEPEGGNDESGDEEQSLAALHEKADSILEKVNAILNLIPVDDIDIPDE